MANINAPFGLRPVQYLNGAPWSGQTRTYFIYLSDTSAYAPGDPVASSSGNADAAGVASGVTIATGGTSNVIRGVLQSAGGTVFGGPSVDPANFGYTVVIPATKTYGYYVQVIDDPFVIFEVQEFSGTGATNFTYADVGKCCNLKSAANNGYVSQWTLDDTAATVVTATRQVKLLGLAPRPGNAFGSYAIWLVQINLHELKAAVAGV
jgi:hypothetical protein